MFLSIVTYKKKIILDERIEIKEIVKGSFYAVNAGYACGVNKNEDILVNYIYTNGRTDGRRYIHT